MMRATRKWPGKVGGNAMFFSIVAMLSSATFSG